MKKPFAFLFILLSILVTKAASIDDPNNVNFNFTDFTPNMNDIVYESSASVSGNVIELTGNQYNPSDSVGRATYYKPMHLWHNSSSGSITLADFTTQFSFSINSSNPDGIGPDGFAFFLAPNGSKIPPSSGGGRMGLQNCDLDGNR